MRSKSHSPFWECGSGVLLQFQFEIQQSIHGSEFPFFQIPKGFRLLEGTVSPTNSSFQSFTKKQNVTDKRHILAKDENTKENEAYSKHRKVDANIRKKHERLLQSNISLVKSVTENRACDPEQSFALGGRFCSHSSSPVSLNTNDPLIDQRADCLWFVCPGSCKSAWKISILMEYQLTDVDKASKFDFYFMSWSGLLIVNIFLSRPKDSLWKLSILDGQQKPCLISETGSKMVADWQSFSSQPIEINMSCYPSLSIEWFKSYVNTNLSPCFIYVHSKSAFRIGNVLNKEMLNALTIQCSVASTQTLHRIYLFCPPNAKLKDVLMNRDPLAFQCYTGKNAVTVMKLDRRVSLNCDDRLEMLFEQTVSVGAEVSLPRVLFLKDAETVTTLVLTQCQFNVELSNSTQHSWSRLASKADDVSTLKYHLTNGIPDFCFRISPILHFIQPLSTGCENLNCPLQDPEIVLETRTSGLIHIHMRGILYTSGVIGEELLTVTVPTAVTLMWFLSTNVNDAPISYTHNGIDSYTILNDSERLSIQFEARFKVVPVYTGTYVIVPLPIFSEPLHSLRVSLNDVACYNFRFSSVSYNHHKQLLSLSDDQKVDFNLPKHARCKLLLVRDPSPSLNSRRQKQSIGESRAAPSGHAIFFLVIISILTWILWLTVHIYTAQERPTETLAALKKHLNFIISQTA